MAATGTRMLAKFNLDPDPRDQGGYRLREHQVVGSVDVVGDYKIALNLAAPSPALLIHLSHAAGVGAPSA